MGPSVELPATGCCGMAGAFGYEKGDHYDVAIACGERVLLPAVRHSSNDTVIIAGGFCCREQIESPAPAAALWWGWRGARTHACRLDTHVEAWHFPHRRSHS